MAGRVDQVARVVIPFELVSRHVMAPERHTGQTQGQGQLFGRRMLAGGGDRADVEPDYAHRGRIGRHHLGAHMPAFEVELHIRCIAAMGREREGKARAGLRVAEQGLRAGIEGSVAGRVRRKYGRRMGRTPDCNRVFRRHR